jgi:acyl carrier protein
MTEQDFMTLLNAVAKIAKPFNAEYKDVTSMSDKLADSGLDSLDMLLTSVYLCDVFDIDEETGKTLSATTVQELFDWLMQHKRRMPESLDAALEAIK